MCNGKAKFRSIVPLSLLLVLGGACRSQSGDSPREVRSVDLRIHAWNGYVDEYKEDFRRYARETHNVDVRFTVSFTSGHDSNVENIVSGIKAHLVSPSNDIVQPLVQLNLIVPVDFRRLKNANQINPRILKSRCYYVNGKTYGVPFNFGPCIIAYNKDKVPPPRSYKVLWDPRYRKRVSMPAVYATVNVYMAALMLGFPREELFRLSDTQLAQVETALRTLCRDQVGDYWYDNLDPRSRDRVDLGIDWGIGVQKINSEYGGNWGCVIPDEGATGWVDTWAITRHVQDPLTEEMAYAWIDFMIGAQQQAHMARVTSYGPINPYAGRYLSAKEKDQFWLTEPPFMERLVLWQPLSDETYRKYQEVWRRAKQ